MEIRLPDAGEAQGAAGLPLLVTPTRSAERPVAALTDYLGAFRQPIADRLLRHGALLLRGFAVAGPADFERVARAIAKDLKNDYLGTSPRDALTPYVFSASELPGDYPIPQHCEMTFVRHPPSRIFFCCLVPPAGPGGETPLCDFRQVYRDLDPAVRARFEDRGVRITRNYTGPEGGRRGWDPFRLKRWDEMFRTTDRAEVERRCQENDFTATWRPGGELRLTNVQPAVKRHPVSGEPVWFNHAQVFHLSSVPAEYRRIAARQRRLRVRVLQQVARALVAARRRLLSPEDQAMHCAFGDGTPIPDEDMEQVREAIWRNMVFFRWQAGDVVALDNDAVAHGRMPYRGPRQVAVCWA